MTVPTGFVIATRVSGVVKVSTRFLEDGSVIPGTLCGPGDEAVISEGEATESDFWSVKTPPAPPTVATSSIKGTE